LGKTARSENPGLNTTDPQIEKSVRVTLPINIKAVLKSNNGGSAGRSGRWRTERGVKNAQTREVGEIEGRKD